MIPKKIHFIWFRNPKPSGKQWSLVHFLAVKSAAMMNPEYEIFLHNDTEFVDNHWWEETKKYAKIVKATPREEIHGNKIEHIAHKADVYRIELLIREGGIYVDADSLTVKPFDDLLGNKLVMGYGRAESAKNHKYILNGVILAQPDSRFLKTWLETYRTFDRQWDYHSCQVPFMLHKEMPEEITVLSWKAFFYPQYTKKQAAMLFSEVHNFPEAYVIQLWESLLWKHVKDLTVEAIMSQDTTYNLLARQFLSDDKVNPQNKSLF